ncbi:MAG: phosphate signaling complex protein PhoU [Verrucomicrobiota bacterium]|jgi:phosphate transport system protein
MPRHFDDELAKFKEILLIMGSYAESSVSQAVQAVTDRNDQLAELVQHNDDIMDRYEIDIDDMAINLLAKAPLATDLRLITVAMKISQNLERIGDEATTIARRALELNTEPQLKSYIDIPRMAGIALALLRESLDAFVNKQPEKARAVVPRDKEVDALNRQLYRELSSYMVENPSTISRCLNLMTVAKSLERVADHAANIAEEVVYLCEARDIRHEANKPLP